MWSCKRRGGQASCRSSSHGSLGAASLTAGALNSQALGRRHRHALPRQLSGLLWAEAVQARRVLQHPRRRLQPLLLEKRRQQGAGCWPRCCSGCLSRLCRFGIHWRGGARRRCCADADLLPRLPGGVAGVIAAILLAAASGGDHSSGFVGAWAGTRAAALATAARAPGSAAAVGCGACRAVVAGAIVVVSRAAVLQAMGLLLLLARAGLVVCARGRPMVWAWIECRPTVERYGQCSTTRPMLNALLHPPEPSLDPPPLPPLVRPPSSPLLPALAAARDWWWWW